MDEGQGRLRLITGTDPAVDTEISEAVPTNAKWKLISIQLTLVTDANAATRRVKYTLDNGTTVYLIQPMEGTQIESLTRNYNIFIGSIFGSNPTNNDFKVELPREQILDQTWAFKTTTTNLQAGDNFAAPQMVVREWLTE